MAEADADAEAAAETHATMASSLQAEPARRGLADGDTSVEQVRMIWPANKPDNMASAAADNVCVPAALAGT